MTFFLFTIIFIALGVFIVLKTSKKEPQQQQQSQQPIHFDLLDDNGDPLPNEPVVQERQYFCIKDKGYHITVWPKDNRIGEVLEFTIAGMSYRDNIDEYLGEHVGTLEAEPTNEYDPNAIKILAEDSHHVGYVPKDMTAEVRKHTSLPCKCFFYIGENDGTYYSDCYIKIQL
jgi:hypothetical protein